MEIDRGTIRAISADTRLRILKRLSERRKMPSELSREVGVAPSTIVEHLRVLEGAALVSRQQAGKKWVYYSITEKGENIISPRIPVRILLTSIAGVAVAAFGGLRLLNPAADFYSAPMAQEAALGAAATAAKAADAAYAASPDYIGIWAFAAGLLIIAASLLLLMRRQRTDLRKLEQ